MLGKIIDQRPKENCHPPRCIMRFSVVAELSRMSFQTVEAVIVNFFLNGPSIDHCRNL